MDGITISRTESPKITQRIMDAGGAEPSQAEVKDAVERTENKYTEEEVRNFASMATKFARAPIVRLLTKMVDKKGGRQSLKDDLAAICPEKAAFACPIELPADVQNEIKMKSVNVWLANGPKNHKPVIDAPSEEFAQLIYTNYEYLKKIAQTFWKQFQMQNPYLTSQLRELLGTDINELKIDPNNLTTMFFDEEFPDRIVILAAFADSKGTLYLKK